jgi:hypothetical protein
VTLIFSMRSMLPMPQTGQGKNGSLAGCMTLPI